MTPEQLKASILQYAIQGKLVEQRPEEGTGEELYQQIQEEKKRLVKEGKIKKEKPLPEIAEDEIPFDIPESWKWVRLSQLVSILNGDRGKNYPSKSTLSRKGIPFISALNLDGKSVIADENLLCMSEQQYEKLGNGKLICNDIVVCIRGSLGKHGRYPFVKGAIASSLAILRPFIDGDIIGEFLMMYLDTPLFFMEIRKYDNGTAQPNLAAKSLEQFLFPLPPIAEQKRIVAKIEELLPYIDRYAAAYEKLEQFNAKFPEDMKKSILQYAIQGKLVEQRPEEGTGEELYQQIQEEKKRLVKEGKIKKEKPLAEITEDEIPFEIPESWKWVRWGEVINIVSARRVHQSDWKTQGIPFYRAREIARLAENGFVENELFISEELFNEFSKSGIPQPGDLMVTAVGTLGKTYVVKPNDHFYYKDASVICFENHSHISPEYLKLLMESELMKRQIKNNSDGTTVATLTMVRMVKYVFPLPPLAEQHRIVAKLEEILPLCDRLK